MAKSADYIYVVEEQNLRVVYDFNSQECLNLTPENLTILSDDPSSIQVEDFFSFQAPATIEDVPIIQLSQSNLQLESACEVAGVDDSEPALIHIFPTILTTNESIVVSEDLSSPIEYFIMDMKLGRSLVLQNISGRHLRSILGEASNTVWEL